MPKGRWARPAALPTPPRLHGPERKRRPPASARAGRQFAKLVELQARLRAPGGCPWDREQTHHSLRPYLLEEAYEVLDALDAADDRKLVSELGDLLLQVVFHAELAREQGRFDAADVIRAIREKLVRRHPHVFGAEASRRPASSAADVLKRWEQLKAEERRAEGAAERSSLLEAVPKNLPALAEAFQMTRRAANVGFDWKRLEGVLAKLEEEARELRRASRAMRQARNRRGARPKTARLRGPGAPARVEEEAGDLLFVAANVARFLGLDPEIALKKANRKFARRFRWMEGEAARRGTPLGRLSAEELDRLWNQAKAAKAG